MASPRLRYSGVNRSYLADEAIRHLKRFAEERRERLKRVGDALFGGEKTG